MVVRSVTESREPQPAGSPTTRSTRPSPTRRSGDRRSDCSFPRPTSQSWIKVGKTEDIEPEDVRRFDHGDRTFAVYRTSDDQFFATDGLCTYARVHLADGFVMGTLIECPKHNGRFDFTNGKAKGAPVCVDLKTYPTKIEAGEIFIQIAG